MSCSLTWLRSCLSLKYEYLCLPNNVLVEASKGCNLQLYKCFSNCVGNSL